MDCFAARAGNNVSVVREERIDELFDVVVGKETGAMISGLIEMFERGKLPSGNDLAQLSGELAGEEQEVAVTLLFFATGALQRIMCLNDVNDDESLLILAAGYEYRHLCRLLVHLGVPYDMESLDVLLEDEPEKLAFLQDVIGTVVDGSTSQEK